MTHGLVDIHQHLIYGVDDGPRNWEETEAMLVEAENQGIERIFATPHATPGRAHFDYDGYLDKLNAINQFAWQKKWKLRLLPGAEIFYTPSALQKLDTRKVPTMAMSSYVLVEFFPSVKIDEMLKALRELANGGYRPILAHVERYHCLYGKWELIEELKHLNALIQMNAQTVLHSNGIGNRFIRRLLEEDVVDFVATDAHNTSTRPVCLQAAYAFLEKHYGREKADLLTWRNQGQIMSALNIQL
ncbi:MAG: hypothetical protein E7319_04155 [Clostridiales bacterium]|nr:hypothetical protein [Clostridiales bacterium]